LTKRELGETPIGAPTRGTPPTEALFGKAEFEEIATREAIGRPDAGDPNFVKGLEESKAREKIKQPSVDKPPASKSPAQAAKDLPGKPKSAKRGGKKIPDRLKKNIKSFVKGAKATNITPELIETEVAELIEDAKDPGKVGIPDDAHYDAEITTSDNHTTYKRERNTRFWDRCWNPCDDGAPVGPDLDPEVDAALAKKKGKKTSASEPTSKKPTAPPPNVIVSPGSQYRSEQGFMDAMLRRIAKKPNHLLRKLVTERIGPGEKEIVEWKKVTRRTARGRIQRGRYEGSEHDIVVQAGHQTAKASGAAEQYMLEEAGVNQATGQVGESKGTYSQKIAVLIDDVPVDISLAKEMEKYGLLPAGTADAAPQIPPPPF
jgi:hypothetical protein